MKYFIFCILLFAGHSVVAQHDETVIAIDSINIDEVYTKVDEMPKFKGGSQQFEKYLASVPYPKYARENDIEGAVFVSFVVDENGNITNVEISKSSGSGILDKSAMEYIQGMPQFSPGKQNGTPVKVLCNASVRYYLDRAPTPEQKVLADKNYNEGVKEFENGNIKGALKLFEKA